MKEQIEKVFRKGNKFYERVKIGKKSLFREFSPEWTCFMASQDGDYSVMTDLRIKTKKQTFTNASKYREFIKTYEDLGQIYGKRGPLYNHIFKNYWNKQKFTPNRVMYLDIEVIEPSKRFFPHPHVAETKVTHIQMLDSFTGQIIIISDRDPSQKVKDKYPDAKMIECKNEVEIFKTFATILKKLNPTIITAYNGMFFDFPYLVMRAYKLGLSPNMFSPVDKCDFKVEFQIGKTYKVIENRAEYMQLICEGYKPLRYHINWEGLYLSDYLEVYKKFSFKSLPSFSLDYVTKEELKQGDGKVSYKHYKSIFEFYEKDYDGFYDYSIVDVIVMKKLEEKLKYYELMGMMADEMGCNIDDIMGTIKPWDAFLTNISLGKNICMPANIKHHLDKTIQGGFVKDPIQGKHDGTISIDYNSLYPSIMSSLNLSPETYLHEDEMPPDVLEIYKYFSDEDETKFVFDEKMRKRVKEVTEKHNIVFAGTAFYKKDNVGIIANIIHELYFERKADKYKMLVADAEMQKIKDYLKDNNYTNVGGSSDVFDECAKIVSGKYNLDTSINLEKYTNLNDLECLLNFLEDFSGLYNSKQLSKKLRMNALYGALATPYFVLFSRDIAASITFVARGLIQDTSIKLDKLLVTYPAAKNGFTNKTVYNDTDSAYITVPYIFEKIYEKIGVYDFFKMTKTQKESFINSINKWIELYLDPIVNKSVKSMIDDCGFFREDFMGAKVEKINVTGIFIAKKRYALATIWNEGTIYWNEPKISFTGLDVVRSSTPVWSIKTLKSTIKKILLETEESVREHYKVIKDEFYANIENPEEFDSFARTSGVNNLGFELDAKGWFRINPESGKRVACPINSRGALMHNLTILKEKGDLAEENPLIEEGNKIKYFYLNPENIIESDVIGYINPKFMIDMGLLKSIDKDKMFDKIYISPLRLITDVVGIDFEKKTNLDDFGLF